MTGKAVARRTSKRAQPGVELTKAQKTRFLELIAEGQNKAEAAAAVKSTGTQFRRLSNPKAHRYDPEFAAALAAALELRNDVVVEQLEDESLHVCFDRGNPSQQRALHYERLFRQPEYRAAHQQRLAAGAKVSADGEIQILLAFDGPADGG